MKIKIKKRFYFFLIFLFLAGGFVLYSRASSNRNEQKKDTAVLAADTTVKKENTYALIDESSEISEELNPLADFEPVTISHTVKSGETLQEIAQKYHAHPQTIIDYPYNTFGEQLNVTEGQIIIIPNGYIDSPPPQIPVAVGSGLFSWPTKGVISQYAFWWHPGAIDIAADLGNPIYAAYPGKVVTVEKWPTGYGWHVVLEHSGAYTSLYAHMSRIDVSIGQTVQRGTRLGLVGSTGRSTGPHLHFEVRKNTKVVDPMTLLPSIKQ